MSVVILHVLCEGQTEANFANIVLRQHLRKFGVIVNAKILITGRDKHTLGGLLNYRQAKRDLLFWMKNTHPHNGEKHYFTTMFDLYALPHDFPGYDAAESLDGGYAMVESLEKSFEKHINHDNFIPYIQLHEFESLVFCGLDYLLMMYPNAKAQVEELKKVLWRYGGNPEEINNSRFTAPSKWIKREIEKKHNYNKPQAGLVVTKSVGITGLKERCRHFASWVDRLETLNSAKNEVRGAR